MKPRSILPLLVILFASGASAQLRPTYENVESTRAALQRAIAERERAAARSQRLEREAAAARDAADRSRRQAAALAARVQEAEAAVGAAEARLQLIDRAAQSLRDELGREQGPIVKLMAALQQFARRPVGLSLLRPGTVQDVVYLRAMLSNTVPEIDRRTAALRERLARSRQLQRAARQAVAVQRREEDTLAERRRQLATLEMRQRLASRNAGGSAAREAERALALAEDARDLDTLLGVLNEAAERRELLAALPGPVMRPVRPSDAPVVTPDTTAGDRAPAMPHSERPPLPYRLPVEGRTIQGFGAPTAAGPSDGITLAPRARAQVVAPAAGRVAFAGPYRGYGRIVIIEHGRGWTSLVTGLESVQAEVGEDVVGGAPIGRASAERPAISLELRNGQQPVNPLPFLQ